MMLTEIQKFRIKNRKYIYKNIQTKFNQYSRDIQLKQLNFPSNI